MQKISNTKLQELANMLHEEPNVGLRNSMSSWIDATCTNHENTSFASISAMAQESGIKDKILAWVDKVLNPDKSFVYIPDIPAQTIEPLSEINEQIENTEVPHIEPIAEPTKTDVSQETLEPKKKAKGKTKPSSSSTGK
jgi:hypothetical protein